MGKPFSDLEKRAYAILANGGDPAQSQDQELAKYWRWRINPSLDSHDLPTASERPNGRKLDEVAIIPFGIDLPVNQYAKTTISKRSSTFISSGVKTALQIKDIVADTTAYRLARFRPAKVYARTGAAENPEERTSRITGRKYKSYYAAADQGYTMPFGSTEAASTVAERQAAISAAIKTQDATIDLITFSPEKATN